MHAIATLGDAPTTAIAAVAILLGLLFAARGPRDKRAVAGGETEAGPSLLTSVPVAAPSEPEPVVEPGFVGPEGTIVGHGTIRLGGGALLGAGDPPLAADGPGWAASPPQAQAEARAAVVDAEPAAPAAPAPPGEAAESSFPGQPEAAEPQATEPASAEPGEPAWSRHAPKPAGFRHGAIKLGGKPVGKPPTD